MPAAPVMQFDFPGAPAEFDAVPGRAGMTRFAALDALSIEGQAGPARLVVELALPPGADPATPPLEARVTYRPEGFATAWQSIAPPDAAQLVLTEIALSGPRPRIAGSFEIPLCFRPALLVPPDPDQCRTATGSFATVLTID